MVQLNNEKHQFTVVGQGCEEDIYSMQMAIIELVAYQDKEIPLDPDTITGAMELLKVLMPSKEQLKRGLVSENDYLELPEKMTPKQRQTLRYAISTMKTGTNVSADPNPVLEALRSVGI